MATRLEKVSFQSNPKERQWQRKTKLPHNITYLTRWQNNAHDSPSEASTVHELRTGFIKGIQNCQHPLDHQKSKRVPEKHLLLY